MVSDIQITGKQQDGFTSLIFGFVLTDNYHTQKVNDTWKLNNAKHGKRNS